MRTRPHLFFPLLNFGYFALFTFFGLLLLLLFEQVVVREEAGEGPEGKSVALTFVIVICTHKETSRRIRKTTTGKKCQRTVKKKIENQGKRVSDSDLMKRAKCII